MEALSLEERVVRALKEYRSDNNRLLKELKKLLREAEKAEDIYIIGRINMHISGCYFDLGNRVQILPYAVKAVRIFEKLNDRNMLARSCNVLGIAYHAQGNYQLSIACYKRALILIRGLRKPTIKRHLLINNISECYFQMGEYHKCVRLVGECLSEVRTKWPDDHISAVIYGMNLSDSSESLGNYAAAMEYLDDVKDDVGQIDHEILRWAYYSRRCCVLYKLGDLAEGARYADLTVEAVNSGCDSYEGHRDFEKIAAMEVKAGDFERAQHFADILTKYAEENGYTLDWIISKRVQANICFAAGDRQRALVLFRELNKLYESRIAQEKAMQIESHRNAAAASREIAKLMKKVRDSEDKAERDALTGLMNRAALVSIANEFMGKAREQRKKLGVVFLDIDFYKEYNDSYGHACGDEAIKLIANICRSEENTKVKFFRYGGDEFVGIVYGQRDEKVWQIGRRIVEKVRAAEIEHKGNPNGQRVTVSVGAANVDWKETGYTLSDLLQCADEALYQVKEHGRDKVFACLAAAFGREFKQV